MAIVRLEMNAWKPITGGDLTIEVYMGPMPYLERERLLEIGRAAEQSVTSETYEDDSGRQVRRETIHLQEKVGKVSDALRYALGLTVREWRDVSDQHGNPIPFSIDAVSGLAGCNKEWGDALFAEIAAVNKLPMGSAVGSEGTEAPKSRSAPAATPKP